MSTNTSVPFPQSGGFIRAVRESSSALRVASGVTISKEAIERLLHSPAFSSTFSRLSQSHGLALPLKFPSLLSELNVIALLSVLNIGSGYRVPLHAHTGRGAWDSIRALVLSMFITSSAEEDGDLLSAKAMKAMTPEKVAELMRVPTHLEKPHESLPGVVVGERGGPLLEFAQLVARIFNETGEVLLSQGYPDLGAFVLEALREGEKIGKARGGGVDVDVVLEKLVLAIPAFRDMSIVGGKREAIYIFKKALFLLHAISLRFSSSDSSSRAIPVPDASALPIFSDNVIPSMLIHLGVIDVSRSTSSTLAKALRPAGNLDTLLQLPPDAPEASDKIKLQRKEPPKEGPILSQDDAYILRASAIDACQQIVDEAHRASEGESAWLRNMTLPEVDAWLWAGAKDRADYRELERFVLRDTVFF